VVGVLVVVWVAHSVVSDVKTENVSAEDIVVISLNARIAKALFVPLQQMLLKEGIQSTVPGLIDLSSEFAEQGRVTLSTVYRAKGNEAPVVYIMGFDALLSYVEEVENRNKAFTALSRAKGWIRVSGIGRQMERALLEIQAIREDFPYFKFTFPDMDTIKRRLDASETSRRTRQVRTARLSAQKLVDMDEGAIASVDPELRRRLRARLDGLDDVSS
jgi:superfamily I DNA and RNA helicase